MNSQQQNSQSPAKRNTGQFKFGTRKQPPPGTRPKPRSSFRKRPRPHNDNRAFTSNGGVTRFSGREIVCSITTLPNPNTVTKIINANPRYNPDAVRLYNVARTFQQWKPNKLSLQWVPTVPTTQGGTVTLGTVWSTETIGSSVMSTLNVSNGGVTGAIYTGLTCKPNLNGRMSQMWYYFNDLAEDSNPFNFAAMVDVANSGYLVLHYDYTFSNPCSRLTDIVSVDGTNNIKEATDGTFAILKQQIQMARNAVAAALPPFTTGLVDSQVISGVGTKVLKVLGETWEFMDGINYSAVNSKTLFRSLPIV